MTDMKRMLRCAGGLEPADLVLKNATVLNVFTEEFIPGDVAICGDTVTGVGRYDGRREIDCTGRYVIPGFIDAHVHIESGMAAPRRVLQGPGPGGHHRHRRRPPRDRERLRPGGA